MRRTVRCDCLPVEHPVHANQMGGRSAEALAKRAEKRGRTVEEEEVKEKEAREKKRKESKPEKPQEPERPAAAAVARRPAAGDPARLPTSQRHDNGLWQRQRELNGKLAHGSRQEIYDLVAAHVHELNSVNVATALHRLAKCAPAATVGLGQTDARWKKAWAAAVSSAVEPAPDQQEVRLAALCGRAASVLREERGVTSRSLTSIAWAVGKLKLAHAGLLASLTEQAGAQLKRGALDAFGVANVAWALATLREARHAIGSGAVVSRATVSRAVVDHTLGDHTLAPTFPGYHPRRTRRTRRCSMRWRRWPSQLT